MDFTKRLSASFKQAFVDAFAADGLSLEDIRDTSITWLCVHEPFFEAKAPHTSWTPHLVTGKKELTSLSRKLMHAVFEVRKEADPKARRPDISSIKVTMQSVFDKLTSTHNLTFLERCVCVVPSKKKKNDLYVCVSSRSTRTLKIGISMYMLVLKITIALKCVNKIFGQWMKQFFRSTIP